MAALALAVLAAAAVAGGLVRLPVGAVATNLAASCTPSGTLTVAGGATLGNPVKDALESSAVPLAIPADVSASSAIRPDGRINYVVKVSFDFPALAQSVLTNTVKPAITAAPGGGAGLAASAAVNLRVTGLLVNVPIPDGLTVVGTPTGSASAGGPSVAPSVVGDQIQVALGAIVANAKSFGSFASTTLANTAPFTVTVNAVADAPGTVLGDTIDLHTGDLAFSFAGPTAGVGGFNVSVNYFGDEVRGGVDGPMGCAIADTVLATTNVTDIAPFTSAAAFVTRQYLDLTGKAPTASQLTAGVNRLNAKTVTGPGFVADLRNGTNGVGGDSLTNVDPVTRLYSAYFLRIPDAGGVNYWIGRKRAGVSLGTISQGFAGSNEFKQRYGSLTNTGFVNLVYQNVLGRPGEAAGVAFWVQKLNDGSYTRGRVMAGFSESTEYKNKQAAEVDVAMAYIHMTGAAPSQSVFDAAVASIETGGKSVADVAATILGSQAYRTRLGLL